MASIEELNKILSDNQLSEPSYLSEKTEANNDSGSGNTSVSLEDTSGNDEQPAESLSGKENNNETRPEEEPEEPVEDDDTEVEDTQHNKKFKCKHPGCDYETDSRIDLMNHARIAHKGDRKKNSTRRRKPKKSRPEPDTETSLPAVQSSDEIDIVSIPEERSLSEDDEYDEIEPKQHPTPTATGKNKKKSSQKIPEVSSVPSDYDRLKVILRSFGVPNYNGVVEGMKLHSIDDINSLKDLLRSVSCPVGKVDAIARIWSDMMGKPDSTKLTDTKQTGKESSLKDPLALLERMRTDDMTDAMFEKYRLANEERRLEIERKKKELEEGIKSKPDKQNNNEEESDFIEYNMPVYDSEGKPVLDKNGKPLYQKVKYNMKTMTMMGMNNMFPFMQNSQSESKYKDEIDRLNRELYELKAELKSSTDNNRTSPEVEALKQQTEMLKQQITETQRKYDEEVKMNQLREEARRERELLEKRIEDQNKKFEELLKSISDSKTPKTEEILLKRIEDMQKQYNDNLVQLKEEFNKTLQEKETTQMFKSLQDELKNVKENTDRSIGEISGSMRDFATDLTHTVELITRDKEHEKEKEELKKKIEEIERSKYTSKEELLTKKGLEMVESVAKGGGDALSTFGKMLNKTTTEAAETMSAYDKAKLALELKQHGFTSDQVSKIISSANNTIKPKVPSAQSEYEKLNQITDKLQSERISNIQQSEPANEHNITTQTPAATPPPPTIPDQSANPVNTNMIPVSLSSSSFIDSAKPSESGHDQTTENKPVKFLTDSNE